MCPWYYNYEDWIYIMIWNCLGMCSSETLFKHYCFLYFQERKRRRLDTAHKSSVIAWSCFKLMCTRVYKHVYKNIIKNKSHHVVIYYNHLIITSHLLHYVYITCTFTHWHYAYKYQCTTKTYPYQKHSHAKLSHVSSVHGIYLSKETVICASKSSYHSSGSLVASL